MPEVLIKVSLALSYPGFFRTGNLSLARVSNRGRLAEIFAYDVFLPRNFCRSSQSGFPLLTRTKQAGQDSDG
jgi:hypothetical protein